MSSNTGKFGNDSREDFLRFYLGEAGITISLVTVGCKLFIFSILSFHFCEKDEFEAEFNFVSRHHSTIV